MVPPSFAKVALAQLIFVQFSNLFFSLKAITQGYTLVPKKLHIVAKKEQKTIKCQSKEQLAWVLETSFTKNALAHLIFDQFSKFLFSLKDFMQGYNFIPKSIKMT